MQELCVAKATLKPERTLAVARNFVLLIIVGSTQTCTDSRCGQQLCIAKAALKPVRTLTVAGNVVLLRQHSDLYQLSPLPGTLCC